MTQLKNRWLVNLVLIVLVIVLAAVVYVKHERDAGSHGPVLTSLDRAKISRLRIERPRHDAIALEKTNQAWRLTAPIQARANRFNVDRLLDLAEAETQTRIPMNSAPLSQYGLDKPQASVWLNDTRIDFGTLHPFKDAIYVRHADTIYLISISRFTPVSYPYTNYIDTRLLEEDRQLLAIKLPDFAVELKDGEWRRIAELKDLSGDRINNFVEAWRNARALSVARHTDRPTREQIRLTFAVGDAHEELVLGVLARHPELILFRKDEDLDYHFPEGTGERLLNLPAE